MKLHVIAALAACMFAGALSAQGSINFSGNVADTERDWLLFSVDFTAMNDCDLDLTVQATSGSAGLDVTLVDLNELAANGTVSAVQTDSDPGTGTMNLTLTTAVYVGVVDFGILIETLSGGSSPYSGTLSTTYTGVSSITANGTQTTSIAQPNFTFDVLGRVVDSSVEHSGADTSTVNCNVDFGSVAQTATFYVNAGGFSDGSVEVYEVDSGGAEQLLGTLSGTSFWGEAGNFTTGSRTGTVVIRLKLISTGATFMGARPVFPSTVVLLSASGPGSGGGGGGGGDDGSCSTGAQSNLAWLGLLALLGVFGLATRLRA